MSTLGTLVRLPQYARNIGRLRFVTSVAVRHGFGHVLVRAGLDRYAGFLTRNLAMSASESELTQLTWEHRVRLVLEALGPTYIKLGQVAATRPDLIPMSLIMELRKLQDHVPSFEFEHVRETIREDLGMDVDEAFDAFDPVPISAASIAQVHRARLKTGEQVVVKVQRPNLEKIIRTDLDLLRMMAATLEERVPESRDFRPIDAIDQFARGLTRETDFTNEIQNIERYRIQIADHPFMHLPITDEERRLLRFNDQFHRAPVLKFQRRFDLGAGPTG